MLNNVGKLVLGALNFSHGAFRQALELDRNKNPRNQDFATMQLIAFIAKGHAGWSFGRSFSSCERLILMFLLLTSKARILPLVL
jgi:hypothetical protein